MVEVPTKIYMTTLAKRARDAARAVSLVDGRVREGSLRAMADALEAGQEQILEANKKDVDAVGHTLEREAARDAVERVRLSSEQLTHMAEVLRRLAELPDPVGELTEMWRRPNGMQVSRMRVPIGVIGVISDMGPDVTTDAVGLCLKSGNVCIVRGGPEWHRTNAAVAAAFTDAAERAGLPAGGLLFVERPEREAALELLRLPKYVDAIIPRGGAALRKAVSEQTRIPILCHDGGVSHVYIDDDADQPLAQSIVVNSKVQHATASNSVDTLLVHQAMAPKIIPGLFRRLVTEFKVQIKGCPKTLSLTRSQSFPGTQEVTEATEEDWGAQFLSKALAVKIVKDFEDALAHIARYGPGHTDTIVTRNYAHAMRFVREVDSSAVLVNASTRLHDGEEFGLGGEIGISTTHIHARGPISLNQLTCEKYVVLGTGQLRQPHPIPTPYEDAIMLKRPS
jgi:glutamate-5-semialdehyde dehydrogenase